MAILNGTKFGVVYTTPEKLINNVSTLQNTDGKLYVLHGQASGALTQGIYMFESNNNDPDGSANLQMIASGAYASSTNAGLLSSELYEKLNNIENGANKYILPVSNETNIGGIKIGYTSNNSKNIPLTLDSSSKAYITLTSDAIISGLGYTPSRNDTTYSSGDYITVSNGSINHDKKSSITKTSRYGDSSTRVLKFGETFKVIDTSVDEYGHILNISDTTLTLPSMPTEVNKVANTFDISVGGKDILNYNGSQNVTLGLKAGNNISITNTQGTLSIDTSGVLTETQVYDAIATALTSALQYKGVVSDASKLPTANNKTGDVYVANGAYTTTQNNKDFKCEVGDLFIFNGTYFDVINGENQVSNKSVLLNPSTGEQTLTIATIDGTDITVKIPAKGSAYYSHPAVNTNASTAVDTSDGGDFSFSSTNKTLKVITGANRDASGHISKLIYKDVTLPNNAYSDTVYVHPISVSGTTLADTSIKSSTETTLSHGGTFTVATGIYRDASGHISKIETEKFKLPTIYSHPSVGTTTTACDTSSLADVVLNSSTSFTVINGVYRDASGHVNKVSTTKYTMPASAFTDTKNTAGSSNKTGEKMLLIGATSTSTGTTYTNQNVYIDASNKIVAPSGDISSGNTQLVTGGAVFDAVENATVTWEIL